ncbi:MAG: hypothetical protein ACTH31_05050, partial [Pseudoclavibacter sp.]
NYWVHGDAPQEARDALHAAMAQVVVDEGFLEEATRLLGEEPPVQLGEEAGESLTAARALTPEQVQWISDYIDEVNAR